MPGLFRLWAGGQAIRGITLQHGGRTGLPVTADRRASTDDSNGCAASACRPARDRRYPRRPLQNGPTVEHPPAAPCAGLSRHRSRPAALEMVNRAGLGDPHRPHMNLTRRIPCRLKATVAGRPGARSAGSRSGRGCTRSPTTGTTRSDQRSTPSPTLCICGRRPSHLVHPAPRETVPEVTSPSSLPPESPGSARPLPR